MGFVPITLLMPSFTIREFIDAIVTSNPFERFTGLHGPDVCGASGPVY